MLNQTELDKVFHALADHNRRMIIRVLSRGPAQVTDLASVRPMSLSALLQHVQQLEASGLVTSQKIGRARMCRLEDEPLRAVEEWVAGRRATWKRHRGRARAGLTGR